MLSPKSAATSPKQPLDQKFWSRFATQYWEQKPFVLRNVKSNLLEMDEAEIFAMLVRYSDRCRKLRDPEGFKFYVDGIRAYDHDVLQVLPMKKDKSLAGYHTRMHTQFEDYCLVCDELLRVNHDKQDLLTEFTDALYRHVGFPNRFSEMGLYLGNYRKTPFGVHVDKCGVFSFPVAGVKKFRMWTSDYVAQNPKLVRAFNYAKYKADSEVMEAQRGDMAYWPSSVWHIAESDGSFSATWSLGVWVDRPHKELLPEPLISLLSEKLGAVAEAGMTTFNSLHDKRGEVTKLPECYEKSIAALQSLTTEELRESFRKSWLTQISQQGFKTMPQQAASSVSTLPAKVRLTNLRTPLLWTARAARTGKKSQLVLSFNGVTAEPSKSKDLVRFLMDLNAGQVCVMKNYVTDASATEALQAMFLAGAFKAV